MYMFPKIREAQKFFDKKFKLEINLREFYRTAMTIYEYYERLIKSNLIKNV